MELGDFFKSAPYARAVNAKPVKFIAICKDKTFLPGGTPNNTKRQVRTEITACFEFIGDGLADARLDARAYLREKNTKVDPKTKLPMSAPVDEGDFLIELQYQVLFRALRVWDEKEQIAGAALFDSVATLRALVEQQECNRLWRAYFDYVDEEHPEVVDTATFPEAQG